MDSAASTKPPRPRPQGPRGDRKHTPKVNTQGLYKRAIKESFVKLKPRVMLKNPVMFVVYVGTIITVLMTFDPNLFGPVQGENLRFF